MQARLAGGCVIADADVAIDVTLHPRLTARGQASKARIDLDNAIKAAVDAMQGVAYTNDRQVVRLAAAIGEAMPDGGLTVRVDRA
jgi:crossover junction endodeoxyribonuclease RusA